MSTTLPTGKAAKLLGVSRWTLKRWAKRGKIETIKLPKGEFSFKKEDLDSFVAAKHKKYERKLGAKKSVHRAAAKKKSEPKAPKLLPSPKVEETPSVQPKSKKRPPFGLSFLKWLTLGSSVLAFFFLGLSIYFDESVPTPQDVLGVSQKKASGQEISSTVSFLDVVMAAATDSGESVGFLMDTGETPGGLLSPDQEVQTSGNVQYLSTMNTWYAYDESPFSYLSGSHGAASPVAIISNAESMRQYPFFGSVRDGDKLFIYKSAGKALIFRPMTNEIIAFGPLDAIPTSTYEESGPIVVLRNGTGMPSDLKPFEEEVKYLCKECFVADSQDAGNGDYKKTTVVDVTGTHKDIVKTLAYKIGAVVSDLPAGEYRPTAGVDILVILGKDRALRLLFLGGSATKSAEPK